jgi:hypothetical protein
VSHNSPVFSSGAGILGCQYPWDEWMGGWVGR